MTTETVPGERTRLADSTPANYSAAAPTVSTLPPSPSTHHNLAGLSPWRFRLVCTAIWSTTFLGAFDGTVVATLLSDIGSSFHAFNLASWLGTAYLLSLCCFTPVYGRLADLIGRRNAQLTAMSFFTLGTIMCGIAPSMNFLIFARAVAGIGGGGIMSVGSIIFSDLVDLRLRGLYQGYVNILFGLGAALGGPIGGWTADHFGWRVAFIAQVPFLVAAFILVVAFVPTYTSKAAAAAAAASPDQRSWKSKLRRIDYLGSALLVLAVGSLLVSVSLKTSATTATGDDYRWSDPIIWGLLVAALVITVAFVLVEGYYASEPILPLSLMVRRTPAAVAVSNFLMMNNMFSILYNVPLYFTAVRLQSSSVAGAHLLPNSILIGLGSLFVGTVMRKTGRYYPVMLTCGFIIVTTTIMMLFWDEHSPDWLTWVGQAPAGFGYAGVLTSTLVALMTNVTKAGRGEIAVATSMSYLFRTIGQVLGVAFSSAILQSTLEVDLAASIPDPAIVELIRRSTSVIPHLEPAYRDAAVAAYAHGLHLVTIMNFVVSVATVACLSLAENEAMPEPVVKPIEEAEA